MDMTTVYRSLRKLRDEGLIVIGHSDENNGTVNWYATTCKHVGVSSKKRDILKTYAISSAPPLGWSHNLKWYESH